MAAPWKNGSSYNQTDISTASLFVDCERNSQTVHPLNRTSNTTTSILPFDDWWCNNNGGERMFDSEKPLFYGFNESVKSYCYSLEKSAYSSYYSANVTSSKPNWTAIKTPPCCDTACALHVSSAQVLYWPTPAPTPAITTVVDSNGFTFSSPSAYVIYQSVVADGDCGVVGKSYSQVTIPFAPGELKTMWEGVTSRPPDDFSGVDLPINFADFQTSCQSTTPRALPDSLASCQVSKSSFLALSDLGSTCLSSISSIQASWFSDMRHCHPWLAAPQKLHSYDPAWTTCDGFKNLEGIVFDPPRALGAASAMAPPAPTKAASQAPNQAQPATPAATLTPPVASKTSNPNLAAPENAPSGNSGGDPGSGDTHPQPDQHSSASNHDDPSIGGATNAPFQQAGGRPPANNPKTNNPPANDPPAGNPPVNNSPPRDPSNNASPQHPAQDPPEGIAPAFAGVMGPSQPQNSDISNTPHVVAIPKPSNPATAAAAAATRPFNPNFSFTASNGDILSGSIVTNNNAAVLAGSTIQAGAPAATINSHQISLDAQASNIVVDGQTHSLPTQPTGSPGSVITAAGLKMSAVSGAVVVGGATLSSSGDVVTVSGTPVRFVSGGVVVGPSSVALSTAVDGTTNFTAGSGTGLPSAGETQPLAFEGAGDRKMVDSVVAKIAMSLCLAVHILYI